VGGRRRWAAAALPLVLLGAVAFHLTTLRGDFLGDDFAFVRLYRTLTPGRFAALFVSDWSQGVWKAPGRELRPLLALSYWADFQAWGANAPGFRLTNLAWLLLALAGLHRLVAGRELREGASRSRAAAVAAVAALLFAAHPTLPGAVDWIAGRSDLLAAAALFWALHALSRYVETGRGIPLALGSLAYAAGLFAKENVAAAALLLAGLLAVEAASGRVEPRRWAAAVAPVALVTAVWLAIRLSAFGAVGGPVGALRSGEVRWGYYAEQLLRLPRPVALALALAGLVALGVLAWRSPAPARASGLFWGVWWPLATLAPAAAATYESPRHVLLAVAGPAVVLARVAAAAWDRWPRGRPATAAAVAAVALALGVPAARVVRLHADMGRASRELRRLLASAPPADVALVAIVSTPRSDDAVFWDLTLPFAAEPPFLPGPRDVLSGPDLYCCADWVEASRQRFERLAGPEAPVVYRIRWDERRRHFVTATLASPFAPGTPPPVTFDEARERIEAIAAVVRGPGTEAPAGPDR
jgi:hypothetical protein